MRGSLQHLLDEIDPAATAAFVAGQIGELLTYDRQHNSDLAEQLEHTLDHFATAADPPKVRARSEAQLKSPPIKCALEFVSADVNSPIDRLALQLALKLRHHVTAAT